LDKLILSGPHGIDGTVEMSKAKNAFLPILAGTILTGDDITLKEAPNLRDIRTMKKLLTDLGSVITETENANGSKDLKFSMPEAKSFEAPYELVKTMRASICVLGPLVSRFGEAKVSLPGGCAIGARPIDFHLEGLKKLGATIEIEGGYVTAKAERLIGNHITLPFPSVGATQNLVMAATLAKGQTVIKNAAKEPEVSDLLNFLVEMGAKITGIGTAEITINGVDKLNGVTYTPVGDRIEAGTYIIAALMTNSELEVTGFDPEFLEFPINVLKDHGAKIEVMENGVKVFPSKVSPFNIETAPYPGFPTDLQAQFMALATTLDGTSIITESVFENRFMHVPELTRFGAKIDLKDKNAIISGGQKMTGTQVMCTDLRASAALLLTALVADGESIVRRVYHLDRGYARLDEKFKELGVDIQRVNDGD
jgi:UDP-N-acetylglucosamine 1-carboxyvinyltransferase